MSRQFKKAAGETKKEPVVITGNELLSLHSTESPIPPKGKLIFLSGIIGSGKTTFVSQIPHSVFLYHEDDGGIIDLRTRGLVPKSVNIYNKPFVKLNDITDQLLFAADLCEQRGLWTIIVEGLSGIIQIWTEHCVSLYYKDSLADFQHFGKGIDTLTKQPVYYPALRKAIQEIRLRQINIVFTAHAAESSKHDSKAGVDIVRQKTYCPDSLFSKLGTPADLCGIFDFVAVVKKSGRGNSVELGTEGTEKVLLIAPSAYSLLAKNRFGLIEPIRLTSPTPKEDFLHLCSKCKISPETLEG